MKTSDKKQYKVIILDDDNFYAGLMKRQLEHYTYTLEVNNDCKFKIEAYDNVNNCIDNVDRDTDLIFMDYYLSDSLSLDKVLQSIHLKNATCKKIVISNKRNKETALNSLTIGADNFIQKDYYAFTRSCYMVEDLLN